MRRIITAIVYNKSGVLSRITSVLNRRQVNIESISVGVVEAEISRMTIVINVNTLSEAEQVTKQLNKQIEVVKVSDITDDPHIERELAFKQLLHHFVLISLMWHKKLLLSKWQVLMTKLTHLLMCYVHMVSNNWQEPVLPE
jgi:predicted amino acid-binding ACT domain protein